MNIKRPTGAANFTSQESRQISVKFDSLTKRSARLACISCGNPPISQRTQKQRCHAAMASRCFGVMPPGGPNAACVVPLIDRLVHRCEVVLIEGESRVLATGTQETGTDLIHDTAAGPTPRFVPATPTSKN